MSKETWFQFADRVKPSFGQIFKDIYGEVWRHHEGDFTQDTNNTILMKESLYCKILPCSLVDAIDHVEKPKLKKVTCYCYLAVDGLYWTTNENMKDPRALDENGERITKDIWVDSNDERYLG